MLEFQEYRGRDDREERRGRERVPSASVQNRVKKLTQSLPHKVLQWVVKLSKLCTYDAPIVMSFRRWGDRKRMTHAQLESMFENIAIYYGGSS